MPDEPDGLFTDLYEFTMVQSYLEHGVEGEATFDLHVRSLPPGRGFLVAGGTATLADRLERFRFDDEALGFLEEQGLSEDLIAYLESFSFDGEIRAVPEGRIVYPYEPIVQITAPLPMAQLVETLVLNTVHVETVLASKAARVHLAAAEPGRPDEGPAIVDFGARRAHGPDAAWAAARNAYIAGFAGTSLVSAATDLGIPCFGTMAHSYVEAFEDERSALEAFARSHPDGTTLLIDTYDTQAGLEQVIELAAELAPEGIEIGGVRIDSGELGALAKQARQRLDEAGLEDVSIFLSGGLDEHAISQLLAAGVPVDGFGVGTSLVVSDDAPSLDISYKLVTYDGAPVLKTSPSKHTLPGAKQVHRSLDEDGTMRADTITRLGEGADGEPLLEPLEPRDLGEASQAARERFLAEIQRVPEDVRALDKPAPYRVARSAGIDDLFDEALARVGGATPRDRRPLVPADELDG